jgi:hypothetical protein
MSLTLFINETCPKCRKPIMHGVIEAHPSRRDIALENFVCADCGPVKTKIISLKPSKPSPVLAA